MGRGLSHMWRIAIIMALLEATSELSTTDLANRLGTSVNRIDHHVKSLLTLGMIESKRSRQVRGRASISTCWSRRSEICSPPIVRHPLPPHADVDAITEHTLPSQRLHARTDRRPLGSGVRKRSGFLG